MAAFLSDERPDAFARVVERLLASPHYGERWGRHWMDVARYADTAGDNADYPVPELSRYRDYIIDSFNADKPFDQFVREQLAGDILARRSQPDEAAEQIVATGFLALSRRYATAPYELWHLTLEDAIDTTGRAFLGLTFRCARCHDHKFDPVTQRDYYALYGIFASTSFPYAGSEEFVSKKFPRMNFVPTAPPARGRSGPEALTDRLKALDAEIADREQKASRSSNASGNPIDPALRPRGAERERLRRTGLPPELAGAYAVAEGKPQDAAIQRGGDPGRPGPVVPRGVPRFAFPRPAPHADVPGERQRTAASWRNGSPGPTIP